jgi:hypothetical protein
MIPIEGKNEKLYCFEERDVLSGELTDWKSFMEVEKERKSIFVYKQVFLSVNSFDF